MPGPGASGGVIVTSGTMPGDGLLLAAEGIDGAGKTTAVRVSESPATWAQYTPDSQQAPDPVMP